MTRLSEGDLIRADTKEKNNSGVKMSCCLVRRRVIKIAKRTCFAVNYYHLQPTGPLRKPALREGDRSEIRQENNL